MLSCGFVLKQVDEALLCFGLILKGQAFLSIVRKFREGAAIDCLRSLSKCCFSVGSAWEGAQGGLLAFPEQMPCNSIRVV